MADEGYLGAFHELLKRETFEPANIEGDIQDLLVSGTVGNEHLIAVHRILLRFQQTFDEISKSQDGLAKVLERQAALDWAVLAITTRRLYEYRIAEDEHRVDRAHMRLMRSARTLSALRRHSKAVQDTCQGSPSDLPPGIGGRL